MASPSWGEGPAVLKLTDAVRIRWPQEQLGLSVQDQNLLEVRQPASHWSAYMADCAYMAQSQSLTNLERCQGLTPLHFLTVITSFEFLSFFILPLSLLPTSLYSWGRKPGVWIEAWGFLQMNCCIPSQLYPIAFNLCM